MPILMYLLYAYILRHILSTLKFKSQTKDFILVDFWAIIMVDYITYVSTSFILINKQIQKRVQIERSYEFYAKLRFNS